MSRFTALWPLLLGLALASACTRPYVPKPQPVDPSELAPFQVGAPVVLSNRWNARRPVRVAKNLIQEYEGDLRAWTGTAITVMERELVAQGMPESAEETRGLTLAIELARARFNDWNVRCYTVLNVVTDAGLNMTVEADAVSFSMYRACSAAVSRAVGRALSARPLQRYLRSPAPRS